MIGKVPWTRMYVEGNACVVETAIDEIQQQRQVDSSTTPLRKHLELRHAVLLSQSSRIAITFTRITHPTYQKESECAGKSSHTLYTPWWDGKICFFWWSLSLDTDQAPTFAGPAAQVLGYPDHVADKLTTPASGLCGTYANGVLFIITPYCRPSHSF
jgi:hypothetical protein